MILKFSIKHGAGGNLFVRTGNDDLKPLSSGGQTTLCEALGREEVSVFTQLASSILLSSSAETSSTYSRPDPSTQPGFRCTAAVPARTWKGEIARTLLPGLLRSH